MPVVKLKIGQLKLDLLNPRIGNATDQREAMQWLINDKGDDGSKVATLAESIIQDGGLNPLERMMVLKDDDGKYIVLEGNRRALALKLLVNPAAVASLRVPPAVQKKLEQLAKTFDRKTIEPIEAVIADRETASTWIERRHNGEDGGRGVVEWSSEAKARRKDRDPALQALEFVRQHGQLTDEERAALSNFPLTTLDRLLSTPAVRTAIGFDLKEGRLFTALPVEEAIKPLKRMALDLVLPRRNGKKLVVTEVKSVRQQEAYVKGLPAADLPDFTKASGSGVALDAVLSSTVTSPSAPTKPPVKPKKAPQRLTLVQKGCPLSVTNQNAKLLEIYKELSTLRLSDYPNAIGVLLRVFMELSVDQYLTNHGIDLKFQVPNRGEKYKELSCKIREAKEHMIAAGAETNDFLDIDRALSDKTHPLSIDLQHAYVHGRFQTPNQRDLIVAWDNAQAFLSRVWP